MAFAYLAEGATSFAAANWSDATGFDTAGAELIVSANTSQITGGLDQTGNPIDTIRFLGGAPRLSGTMSIEFDAASALPPAFQWSGGGSGSFSFVGTPDCDNFLMSGSAQLRLVTGEIGSWIKVTGGTLVIEAGFTFGSGTVMSVEGGNVLIEASSGSDVLPEIIVSGGRVTTRRTITTITGTGGQVMYDGPVSPTTVTLSGVAYMPLQNPGATIHQFGMGMITRHLAKPSTVTTYNVRAGLPAPTSALLTITTRNEFGSANVQSGPPLF